MKANWFYKKWLRKPVVHIGNNDFQIVEVIASNLGRDTTHQEIYKKALYGYKLSTTKKNDTLRTNV